VGVRRTTVAADTEDLAILAQHARTRGVSLATVLGEAVGIQADRLRRQARPRFGVVRGDGGATGAIGRDERAPVRRRGRS
jgi:hypothetical protein